MKIVTYNINGIRASTKRGLLNWIDQFDADVFCFQEVRCDEKLSRRILFQDDSQMIFFGAEQKKSVLAKFHAVFNCGEKPGYAGTLILSKQKPEKILFGMGEFWNDDEGRTTTIFLGDMAIVNAYVPNGNIRLEFKMKYLDALKKFLSKLKEKYRVVCCGDFNIAHNEIDLSNPRACQNKSVFLPIERKAFDNLVALGLIDCFRFLNPQKVKYSWRSYRSMTDTSYNSWKYRIDYVLASNAFKSKIKTCEILDLLYSDHLPVVAEIEEKNLEM